QRERVGQVLCGLYPRRDLVVVAVGHRQHGLAVHLVDGALSRLELPVRGKLAVGVGTEVVLEENLLAGDEIVVLIRLEPLRAQPYTRRRQNNSTRCPDTHPCLRWSRTSPREAIREKTGICKGSDAESCQRLG